MTIRLSILLTILALHAMVFPLAPARAQVAVPHDNSAAVIFAYYRVGEDQYPPTNIRLAQFMEHMEELQSGAYTILPLPQIIDMLESGRVLPPRTVALTFDGGYRSVLDQAVPYMLRHNIPFTIFVSSGYADGDASQYIGWDDLKKLARNSLVTIGLHPASYTHLADAPDEEIRRQINNARARLRQVAGVEATLFAYPFGEYSNRYKDIVRESGFRAAFGQHSGVAHDGSDLYALPRFTMTEGFGGLDRFRMTANALPLPVSDVQPADPWLDTRRPAIGFSIDPNLAGDLGALNCFASGQGKPQVQIIGENRVELRLDQDFEEDRIRINCTLPVPTTAQDEEPRWRWFGMLMTPPENTGSFGQSASVPE